MATYVTNQPAEQTSNGVGFLIGVFLIIAVAVLFFLYGLPLLRGGYGGTSVNVPSTVNVQPQK